MTSSSRAVLCMLVPVLLRGPSLAGDTVPVTGGGLRLTIDKADSRIAGVQEAISGRVLSSGKGGLRVFDGATEKRIALADPAHMKAGKDSVTFSRRERAQGLHLTFHYRGLPDRIQIRVSLTNRGSRQRWIEVQVGMPIDYRSGTYRYWDGHDRAVPVDPSSNHLAINADPVVRHAPAVFEWGKPGHSPGVEAAYVFPVTCVFDNTAGVALGIDLNQIVGYHSGGVQPSVGPHRAFHYGAKVVLDPNQSQTVTLIAFRFVPEFGWRDCVERVYEMFPRHYTLRADVDQRVTGPCGGVWDAYQGTLISEQHRRLQNGWIWYYAPFQTTGLTFPDRADWNPTRQNANAMGGYNTSYDHFIHRVTDACETMHAVSAVGFYVYNWRADYYAARRYFPKAMCGYFRPKGMRPPTPRQRRGGTVLGDGVEGLVGVCALEPTLLERTKGYYRRIAEVYKPDGLAFDDCAGAAPNYFDQHALGGPGRWFSKFFSSGHVFNDRKVHLCVPRGVAVKVLGDEVHKLKNREGKPLFLAANTPTDYLACGVVDVALTERVSGPHFIKDSPFWGLGLRKMMGQKPICYGMGHRGEKFDRHDYNLFCLHVGATRIQPWEKEAQDMIPLLRELARAGWRAAPGATATGGVLLSRFGKGLGTHIVAVNRGPKDVKTTIHVRNHYIGSGRYVFAHYDGTPAANRIVGSDTDVRVLVPAKGYIVLSAVACIKAPTCQATITASRRDEGMRLQSDTPVRQPIALCLPEGARLKQVRCGAATTAGAQQARRVRLNGLTTEPVAITYWPRVVFLSTVDEIRRFPFYGDDKPSSAVLFSSKRLTPRPEETDVCVRMSSFFALHRAFIKCRRRTHSWYLLQHAARGAWIQTKMLEWMEPAEAAIVVTDEGGIPIPDDVRHLVKLGRGVVAVRKGPDGRPVLFVTGPDRPTIRQAVDTLVVRLQPYFPAFKWEK